MFEEQVDAGHRVCLNELLQHRFTALRTDSDQDEIGVLAVRFV